MTTAIETKKHNAQEEEDISHLPQWKQKIILRERAEKAKLEEERRLKEEKINAIRSGKGKVHK